MPEETKAQETAIFDFEEMSWGESKALTQILAGLGRFAEGAPDKSLTVDDLIENFDQIERLIGKWIVSVPRSWLVKRAPADIDWQVEGALNWLKRGKFLAFLMAAQEALQEGEKKA